MFPQLIDLFGLKISTYGVLVAIAMVVGYFLFLRFSRREGINPDSAEMAFIITVLAGLVGSRIAFILEHPEFVESFLDIFAIWKGGVSFFGGLIGAILAFLISVKAKSLPVWKTADAAAPSLVLAHSIGRLGCTSAGCCYGRPVPGAEDLNVGIHFMKEFPYFYVVFPQGSTAPPGIALYPTQILEAIGNLLIFIVLLILYRRKAFDGEVITLYLVLYGALRFALEFYRGVTPPIGGLGITWNQVVALILILLGILLFLVLRKGGSVSPQSS
jgi:phosphatidylglycerol:prolipoprotein diacylglycerol transferase